MVLYNATCLDITSEHTPDPWVIHHNNKFYMTFTANDRIPMWDVGSIMDLYDRPNRGPVWTASPNGPLSERLWAPELHCLRGRWYIYFAAADKAIGNRSHRMYVLGGPDENTDPHAGPWEGLGPIAGMDQGQWAIDGTVCEIDNALYFVYSGWPRRDDVEGGWETRDERIQQLFIIALQTPTQAASEPVLISQATHDWERLSDISINEGPQWLESPTRHWRGLVYSCGPSWTKHYKMATLEFIGPDPLNATSWRKSSIPLLQNRPDGKGPFGPGHGCFLHAAGETMALFHATDREDDGSSHRRCRMQRVRWTKCGPDMGRYVGAGMRDVALGVFLRGGNGNSDGGWNAF
ncbi:Arabinanase/levansucrase/invertase [Acrodontium crateriforme]|uniref:Arabinanase/levansucrase/invertase n=1 Tax=Acrodontium crateriforme TaxID=150365 RepID=A0AAQ3M6W6_9PEZI|nr:Arabinanase/levansucrase/invertase [Acrodontium crateriforme]